MNTFSKMLIVGTSFALLSTSVFATNCPSVGGYKVSSSNADHTRCTYTSYNKGSLGIEGQRAVHHCPRFILTDPNFRQEGQCRVSLRPVNQNQIAGGGNKTPCQCTIVAQ